MRSYHSWCHLGSLLYQPRVAGLGLGVVEVLVFRVGAVIGHAGLGALLVRAVAGLEPGEAGAEVLGDAETQALFLRGLLPLADDVAFAAPC